VNIPGKGSNFLRGAIMAVELSDGVPMRVLYRREGEFGRNYGWVFVAASVERAHELMRKFTNRDFDRKIIWEAEAVLPGDIDYPRR
jgi:hypothetical protein